jgi:hypothetical protein
MQIGGHKLLEWLMLIAYILFLAMWLADFAGLVDIGWPE